MMQLDECFVEFGVDDEAQDAETVVHHLVRISFVHCQLRVAEYLHILVQVDLAEAGCVARIPLHHLLENQRLQQIGHVALSEGLFELLDLLPVLLVHPEAAIRVRGWLGKGFLLNFDQDALDAFHLVGSLARLLQEAHVDKQPFTQVLRIHIFVAKQVSVEATNVFVLDLLLENLGDLVEVLLVAGRDFLCNLARLVVVYFGLQLPVVVSDLDKNLFTCKGSIGVLLVKIGLSWHVEISIDVFGVRKFTSADVDDIVRRLGETPAAGFLKNLLFFDDRDAMIVVAAPDALIVVLDIAVVMTALSSAIMDANSMQMVSLVSQRRVLRVEKVLLILDLLLEALDLLSDLGAVRAEHLLNDS